MIVFSFCEQLLEDISVQHVNYCFFNKRVYSENDAALTDCLTVFSEDDVTGGLLILEAASNTTSED